MLKTWAIDDVTSPALLDAVASGIPGADWPHWVRYNNDIERKRTTRDVWRLNDAACRLFAWLASAEWVQRLEQLSGISGLFPDPTLHGGGLHVSGNGGYLGRHLDYALHPRIGLERRVNVVLFLTPQWREEWGGALQFWDDSAENVLASYLPRFGRAVIWENSDIAYHSAARVTCPPSIERVTAAAYYLTRPREGVTRKRALFVPDR